MFTKVHDEIVNQQWATVKSDFREEMRKKRGKIDWKFSKKWKRWWKWNGGGIPPSWAEQKKWRKKKERNEYIEKCERTARALRNFFPFLRGHAWVNMYLQAMIRNWKQAACIFFLRVSQKNRRIQILKEKLCIGFIFFFFHRHRLPSA